VELDVSRLSFHNFCPQQLRIPTPEGERKTENPRRRRAPPSPVLRLFFPSEWPAFRPLDVLQFPPFQSPSLCIGVAFSPVDPALALSHLGRHANKYGKLASLRVAFLSLFLRGFFFFSKRCSPGCGTTPSRQRSQGSR